VLVIIGLLIGGILVGQSMIESSKINKTVSELRQYEILAKQFKDVYHYFPGDVSNSDGKFGSGVSNGNQDGTVRYGHLEMPGSWEQLNRAGFVDTAYDGSSVNGVGGVKIGVNVPATPLDKKKTAFIFESHHTANSVWNVAEYTRTWIQIVAAPTAFGGASYPTDYAAMTTARAMAMDEKMDDGKPATGKLIAYSYSTQCVNTSWTSTGDPSLVQWKPNSGYPCYGIRYYIDRD